ncbi:nucleotidyltransferase [Planotetraspora silvatica]|uniref:Nucleotidyltransferase n=1 Tax=Planotetraspora silvatica TaxID=234614 RepID=A0A8J3XQ76_9ACTN|nr:nucleotidyltransferase domain-containing protein [Planotetraspora silvatica]GII50542.1 nucleotidyltransferase [Planotetraspora silvatica]
MVLQLPGQTVLSVVTGSRAYGLETEGSDTDRRGVFVTPAPLFWRLDKPPTHVEGPMPEQFSWEVERFCVLALSANPTVLECLWSPIVEHSTRIGDDLLAIRTAFLSRRAVETFASAADDQFRRLDPDGSRRPGSPMGEARRAKMAMHVIRLLLGALNLAVNGEPLVRVGAHRDRLLAVRHGRADWPEVRSWRDELVAEIAARTAAGTALPDRPDRELVEEFVVAVRRSSL